MNNEDIFFKSALHNFVADVAYVKSIRHLYDLGYDIKKIQSNMSYPVSRDTIEKVIADYEKEKRSPERNFEIVETTDRLGNRTFIKVRTRDEKKSTN